MAEVILEACNLVYRFPGNTDATLRGLNLKIAAGERLALLGANGAGKTTLLLHLNGTLRPQTGSVLLDGQPVGHDRNSLAEWRRQVGVVLQESDDQLFAATVAEDVSFGPLNLGLSESETRQRVTETLGALQIASLANRPPHLLSHGQRKRAAIAGILAMRPRILILDEPTAGLDHQGKIHLLAILSHLSDTGTTIVFSTHDVDFAYAWADTAALFADGQVLEQGPITTIMTRTSLLQAANLAPPMVLVLQDTLRHNGIAIPTNPPARTLEALAGIMTDKLFQMG
ncbi:MAG: ATP-binding cassette domain-containing protein [Magnetococcales bacterium]|nr:ATP-binding cassette domain-containing protein [Magnetococcales bacterium]